MGVDLDGVSNNVNSVPGRIGNETRSRPMNEESLRRLRLQNGPTTPRQVIRRPTPSNNTPVRYGQVSEGRASNAPVRQDQIVNARPIRGRVSVTAFRQENSPKDTNPYQRGTFQTTKGQLETTPSSPRIVFAPPSPAPVTQYQRRINQAEVELDARLTSNGG